MDNKHKIINFLGKNLKKRYTMHELSILLKIPYASFYRTIQKMKDILCIESVGKAKTIQLDLENSIVKAHLIVASDEERKEFLQKHKLIRIMTKNLETKDVVLLFGSYAKGKQTERSDIDFLIINKDGKRSISFSKYELLFKKEINPIFVTRQEFKNMLKNPEENVGKQAVKSHIILNNPEEFWGFVLHVVSVKDGVLFKRIVIPDVSIEFEKVAKEIQKHFKDESIKKKDVRDAVKWARRKKSS